MIKAQPYRHIHHHISKAQTEIQHSLSISHALEILFVLSLSLQIPQDTTESMITVDWENGFVEASAKLNRNISQVTIWLCLIITIIYLYLNGFAEFVLLMYNYFIGYFLIKHSVFLLQMLANIAPIINYPLCLTA